MRGIILRAGVRSGHRLNLPVIGDQDRNGRMNTFTGLKVDGKMCCGPTTVKSRLTLVTEECAYDDCTVAHQNDMEASRCRYGLEFGVMEER